MTDQIFQIEPQTVFVPAGVVGTQGPPGPPGSGSTIAVQDESTLLGSSFTRLKITGSGATATDAGSGVAQIDIPGGSGGDASIIYLANHGVVADGTTVNSAAAVEALIAANFTLTGRGSRIVFPYGKSKFDRHINIDYPCILDGYGKGTSVATSPTVLLFPAGSNGLHFRNGTEAGNSVGAYGSVYQNFWIDQVGVISATGTCNYNGSTGISITGGSLVTSNGQMVLVEGASTPLQIPDRTYSTTSGSTTVTCAVTPKDFLGGTPGYGNHVGYPGMVVTGTGIPSGATMTPGIAGAMTLSANATATNSGIAINIVPPILGQIQSGGGTSSLVIDDPTYGASASGVVIRHCPAAVYITCGRVTGYNVYHGYTQQGAGVVIRGHTSDGSISDSCKFAACEFQGADFGVVFQGSDSQVHSFFGCNMGANITQCGVLDNSEFGSDYHGCEWAFNLGILVVQITNQSKIFGGYMESGTTYIATTQSLCAAYDVVSMVNGSGWSVERSQSGVKISGPLTGEWGDFFNGFSTRGAHPAFFSGSISGAPNHSNDTVDAPHLGIGQAGGGFGNWIVSYAHSPNNATYEKLHLEGSEVWLSLSFNSADFKLTSGGVNIKSGMTYSVAGTQVVGPRQTGWTAATGTPSRGSFAAAAAGTASATYTQSELQGALTRIAALEARLVAYDADLRTHGLIGS